MALYNALSNKPNLLLYSRGMFAAVVTGENDVNTGEARNVFDDGCRATPSVLHMDTRAESLDNDCIDLFCIGAIQLRVVQILS